MDIIKHETGLAEKEGLYSFTEEEKNLIKQTLAKNQNLTDSELALFGYVAKKAGLDPFAKQIYCVKFTNNVTQEKEVQFITGIDGYRSIAEKTGKYAGGDEYLYDEGLTVYQMLEKYSKNYDDMKNVKVIPRTATCTVYKVIQGVRVGTTSTVRWTERYPKLKNKQWPWDNNQFGMLGKCAEALALRRAFPNVYQGILLDTETDNMGYSVGEPQEDTVEFVNEVYKIYDVLGLNKAGMVARNVAHCGKSALESMNIDELEALKSELVSEIELIKEEGNGET